MKIGVLIGQPKPVSGFDLTLYNVKSCTGKINKAADHVYNVISCFGDNKTARERPEWVAVSKYGKAVRANRRHRFLWDWICPTVEEHKAFLIDLINETLKADITGVHLECIGFPSEEYCTCQRCVERREENKLGWVEWRAKIVNEFIEEASKLVREKEKSFSVTLIPDPCFGKERYGEDFRSLAKYVDFFLVPLYDIAYLHTYWVKTLAYDFYKQLEKPLYIELYGGDPRPMIENLLAAIVAISNYADGVILATHDVRLSEEIRDRLVKDDKLQHFLEERGCESMMNIIRKWNEDDVLYEPK